MTYGSMTMFLGKPATWWIEIARVLELRRISDASELERALSYRAPDDWSGY